ncbi:MAG: short-chain dehydrogenase [Thermoproteota archaeon]|nr:MAG: short-chain dehydrogenase [Candidatus Korarchaeota archaeon]
MPGRAEGKVVIVTGGARGIGAAICEVLAREGAKVAITDILDKEGKELEEKIRRQGGIAKYYHMDVTKESEVKDVFAQIAKDFGKINGLVNNAGILGVNKPTHEVTEEEWDKVMAVNVKGVFFCTKHVIPYMKEAGGGSIVNIASVAGLIGNADVPPYHASKGAVIAMTKNDATIYAKDNIRVNAVCPGATRTKMIEDLMIKSGMSIEEGKKAFASFHLLGRLIDPEDQAYAVLYLISDESKNVTGTTLLVDAGWTAK